MFVCTVRVSAVKIIALLVAIMAVIGILALNGNSVLAAAGDPSVELSGIKTEEDRRSFLKAFGIEAADEIEVTTFVMPESLDKVLLDYNEVQKAQGLDLSRYTGKKITRYTYTVSNFEGHEGAVYANLLIWRGRIIGCDISSADPAGFVKPIINKS
jgi:hypothetical protein